MNKPMCFDVGAGTDAGAIKLHHDIFKYVLAQLSTTYENTLSLAGV